TDANTSAVVNVFMREDIERIRLRYLIVECDSRAIAFEQCKKRCILHFTGRPEQYKRDKKNIANLHYIKIRQAAGNMRLAWIIFENRLVAGILSKDFRAHQITLTLRYGKQCIRRGVCSTSEVRRYLGSLVLQIAIQLSTINSPAYEIIHPLSFKRKF